MALPLPPLKDTVEALQQDVLPAAGGAALVLCLFLICGKRAAAVGAAAAVAFAFVAANFSFQNSIDDETRELVWSNTYRLAPWKADPVLYSQTYELTRAAVVLLLVGLITRWVGLLSALGFSESQWWVARIMVWVPRAAAVYVVGGWLVSDRIAAVAPSLRTVLRIAMMLNWLVLDSLARARESAEIALDQGAILFAASGVLLYAHSAKSMEVAVVIGAAMFGIALVSLLLKTDVSGAIPATVVFLPGLVLGGQPTFETKVPSACFWLVSLVPLLLAPFLLPALSRKEGWKWIAFRTALILIPLAAAINIASQFDKLPFEEEE